jgi:hypothetical protein
MVCVIEEIGDAGGCRRVERERAEEAAWAFANDHGIKPMPAMVERWLRL